MKFGYASAISMTAIALGLHELSAMAISNLRFGFPLRSPFTIFVALNWRMTDFAAIDFETANNERTSVCSVGVVVVRQGEITDRIYRLIKPEPDYYLYWNTRVHGLTAEDTADAPVFPAVWTEIAPKVAGLPLVAHNSAFDEGCLKAVFKLYQMDYPDYRFHCTYKAARRQLGQVLTKLRLPVVAAYCGYDLAQHHHALADAEACAWIARELL